MVDGRKILGKIAGTAVLTGVPYYIIADGLAGEKADKVRSEKGTVLHFGCGKKPVGDANCDFTQRDAPNFTLLDRNTPVLPYPDGHFHTAIAIHVLQTLEKCQDWTEELTRVAGKIFATWPDRAHLDAYETQNYWVFDRDFNATANPFHIGRTTSFPSLSRGIGGIMTGVLGSGVVRSIGSIASNVIGRFRPGKQNDGENNEQKTTT